MVTLKGVRTACRMNPFSVISPLGEVEPTDVTKAFDALISSFHETWYCIEPIRYYVIMPDHLHLIIKILNIEKRVSLCVVVRQLLKALERKYREVTGMELANGSLQCSSCEPVFEWEWHDWIVKKEGQLEAFRRYIAENPMRFARRRANRQFFSKAREITFMGRRYWAYGNEELLNLPMIVAIKGHRSPLRGSGASETPLQNQISGGNRFQSAPMSAATLLEAASRIGPGGAGVSTFLSPLEKDAGNAIIKAGGSLIVLSMTGFSERWHLSEKQELLCAEGRMLYLSPYAPQAAKLDNREMHIRAHALIDWAIEHSQEHLEAWAS